MGTGYKLFDSEAFNSRKIEYTETTEKSQSNTSTGEKSSEAYLKAIDKTTQAILKALSTGSQSNAKNALNNLGATPGKFGGGKTPFYDPKSFVDRFEKSILDGVLGPEFEKEFADIVNNFTESIGVNLEDIPGKLGEALGQNLMNTFKESNIGKQFGAKFDSIKEKSLNALAGGLDDFANIFTGIAGKNVGTQAANLGLATTQAANLGTTLSATSASAAASSISLGTLGIAAVGVVAALVLVKAAAWALGPALEGTKVLFDQMKESGNRYETSRKGNIEDEATRLREDVRSMIKAPFEILTEAANAMYQVWDQNLRLINATQGYNKSDLQSLISTYSERLRNEGIASYVSSTDITDNLAKVLESGLSGRVAEEFAYIATKLNAAVPTQDFFSYGSTYASLAANAIKNGKSQSEAIAYANEQLELFASDILYASRQLAGGFSSGLNDAQSLFTESVKIAQASKIGDPSRIAGVLTSVSAIVGSIAPDLASSMTEAVVKATTGGNSNEIVALRSLAGINASNTEFLKSFAHDPQGVFSTLFKNLADMQTNLGEGAYMERAEAFADTFGLSMDAFARIDFNYLASAISNMKVDNSAISENLELLASGQTTATAEQLKIAQINKYAIEEGLAYVLDNEVARSIQEHMWDEQLSREMREAEYAVNLQGAALEFLAGIQTTVERIQAFINPKFWVSKIVNVVDTAKEAAAQKADIRQLLEIGKVGSGNVSSLYQLTTGGVDLNVTPSILSHMGGLSAYEQAHAMTNLHNHLARTGRSSTAGMLFSSGLGKQLVGYAGAAAQKLLTQGVQSLFDSASGSMYKWGTLGKSSASVVNSMSAPSGVAASLIKTTSATTAMANGLSKKIETILSEDYMYNKFAKQNKDYDAWKKAATSYLGVKDLDSALAQAGYNVDDIRNRFGDFQNKWGIELKQEREKKEEQFWIDVPTNQNTMINNQNILIELVTAGNKKIEDFYNKHQEFYKAWCDYWVHHTAYNKAYDYSSVSRVMEAQKRETGDAIYALAEALTANTVDLRDPAVQTNSLLGQILIVVNAIMQQNNKVGPGTSLADTLSGLALDLYGGNSPQTKQI